MQSERGRGSPLQGANLSKHCRLLALVTRRDDDSPFCRIFVHMRYWPIDNPQVAKWRQTLMDDGEIKVVYKHPWFWKCVKSRLPKPEKKTVSANPYIMTPEAESDDTTPVAQASAGGVP